MTIDDYEAQADRAWASNNQTAWHSAASAAATAGLNGGDLHARVAALDGVSLRDAISLNRASFWRKVIDQL